MSIASLSDKVLTSGMRMESNFFSSLALGRYFKQFDHLVVLPKKQDVLTRCVAATSVFILCFYTTLSQAKEKKIESMKILPSIFSSQENNNLKDFIKSLEKENIIAENKKDRFDYSDYYIFKDKYVFLDVNILVLEHEYMKDWVGCCVDPGIALYVSSEKDPIALREFSNKANCELSTSGNKIADLETVYHRSNLKRLDKKESIYYLNCKESVRRTSISKGSVMGDPELVEIELVSFFFEIEGIEDKTLSPGVFRKTWSYDAPRAELSRYLNEIMINEKVTIHEYFTALKKGDKDFLEKINNSLGIDHEKLNEEMVHLFFQVKGRGRWTIKAEAKSGEILSFSESAKGFSISAFPSAILDKGIFKSFAKDGVEIKNIKLPNIQFNLSAKGLPVIIIAKEELVDIEKVLSLAPALTEPRYARAYAQVVNHLAKGYKYEVIMSPEKFKADYMEKYNSEEINLNAKPGTMRLRNFALPNFDDIKVPAISGGELVFFAKNSYRGTAFRVTRKNLEDAIYLPVKSSSK